MTEPVSEADRHEQEQAASTEKRDMGLRSHLREIAGSTRSMTTIFLVLAVLIVIAGGCALLLR